MISSVPFLLLFAFMGLTGKALPLMFTMFSGELNNCQYGAVI
jgi:hypothetical protein